MSLEKPTVAAIGLDDDQVASIEPWCAELNRADSWAQYLDRFALSETEIAIVRGIDDLWFEGSVHLLLVAPGQLSWPYWHRETKGVRGSHTLESIGSNTERRVKAAEDCPDIYASLAAKLAKDLTAATDPPVTFSRPVRLEDQIQVLAHTTSGFPVALRCEIERFTGAQVMAGRLQPAVVLVLPRIDDIRAWFRALLHDIHEIDPAAVPRPPPRLAAPADWHTPEELDLAEQIADIDRQITCRQQKRELHEAGLDSLGRAADDGIRQALWGEGTRLVAAVKTILERLGFEVRDMDAETPEGQLKREDLRLTHPARPGWEAISEVKGYSRGTKTSDARQINEYRNRYRDDEGTFPDLTLWIANPYNAINDPSDRPPPDDNVNESAANIETVHVLTADLYRVWAMVEAGQAVADQLLQELIDASPGIWRPTMLGAPQ